MSFAGPCALTEQLAKMARSQSEGSRTALELLERTAAGKAGEIVGDSTRLGLASGGALENRDFLHPSARACALRQLGETGLADAELFLTAFRQADVGTDSGNQVWPSAQIGLRNIRLLRIQDPQLKVEFLERTLTEPHDADSDADLKIWAANQLCDRGALESLAVTRTVFLNLWSGRPGEVEAEFCETRIRVMHRDSDPVKAIATVLSVDSETRLLEWAVARLTSMHLQAADVALDRFADTISKLPGGSPTRQRLGRFKQQIERTRVTGAR